MNAFYKIFDAFFIRFFFLLFNVTEYIVIITVNRNLYYIFQLERLCPSGKSNLYIFVLSFVVAPNTKFFLYKHLPFT